jgi:hypothetical protein
MEKTNNLVNLDGTEVLSMDHYRFNRQTLVSPVSLEVLLESPPESICVSARSVEPTQ